MRETTSKLDDGVVIRAIEPDSPGSSASWRLVYYPPYARMKTHRHDVAQFSVLLAGRLREITRRGTFDSRSMLMEYKPVNFEHANEFGPDGALLLSINVDPESSYLHSLPDAREWRLRPGRAVQREWAQLAQNILSGRRADSNHVETITGDLLAAMADTDEELLADPPPWLARARDAVIETDSTVETIADDAGVHRVHLSRAFRRHYGCSITECRGEAKLARAVRILADNRAAVSAASAAGFADQSHMTRVMRREVGVTPAAFGALFRL